MKSELKNTETGISGLQMIPIDTKKQEFEKLMSIYKKAMDIYEKKEKMVGEERMRELERVVTPAEKIAQLVVVPFLSVEFSEVSELSDTARGEGGFGSTGKH